MTPDERAGLRQAIANDPGTMSWPSKTVSELLDDLDTAEAERDQARALVIDYENRITWHTTCQQCATTLDRAIADFERAEKAEAQRDRARAEAERLTAIVNANKCPYEPPCANCQPRTVGTRTHVNPRPLMKWDQGLEAYVPAEPGEDGTA